MGRHWSVQYRGTDARISCVHHPKKVRTWQAHRSLALPADAQHISIGLCMAQDGAAGIWSPSALASAELAAAELNQRNGIAGRQVRLVCLNASDESANFEDELLRAIDTHGIEALVGMHTSAVRERIIQSVGGMIPFVYTPLYEGGEVNPGVFTLGETPAQQLRPAIDWLSRHEKSKRWLLVGNDYVWPRVSHRLAHNYVEQSGGIVLDSIYLPMGTQDFSAVLDRMQSLQVDAVLVSLVGQDAITFNRQFGHAGLSRRAVRLSCAIEENVLMGIGSDKTEGLYVAASYFANLQTDANLALQERFSARHGLRAPVLNALGQSTYEGMHFLAAMFDNNLHLPEHWPQIAKRNLAYQSARGASYVGNHFKNAPVYLACANGHQFQVVTRF
jgi:ABC-type branched-subunit amino acid transport system substrate-binding protein